MTHSNTELRYKGRVVHYNIWRAWSQPSSKNKKLMTLVRYVWGHLGVATTSKHVRDPYNAWFDGKIQFWRHLSLLHLIINTCVIVNLIAMQDRDHIQIFKNRFYFCFSKANTVPWYTEIASIITKNYIHCVGQVHPKTNFAPGRRNAVLLFFSWNNDVV